MAAGGEDDARVRLEAALESVRERFLAKLDARIAALVALVRPACGPDGTEARASLVRGLHSLAGSAPTVGFPELGSRARSLEAKIGADQLTEDVAASIERDVAELASCRH